MKVSKDRFFSIGSEVKISKEQLTTFWDRLEATEDASQPAPFTKYLFYLGAMIVISAMTWFMNLGWELFGGGGIFLIATSYALLFTKIGSQLWNKKHLKIPGGLLITIAVCMVPLAIYGLQTYFSLWPTEYPAPYHQFYEQINQNWILMDVGTIFAGLLALYFFPFAFLTAPIFFASWFLLLDTVPFFLGKEATWEQKCWMSLWFGLLLIAIGFIIDRKKKEEYAFWSYLFGTLSFWGSLNCLVWDKGEGVLVLFLFINLLMMCLSIFVRRNVLMVFGAIGVFAYLSHLTHTLFEDSILFPFILSLIGLGIIYLGILYQRNWQWIEKKLFDTLPSGIRAFLEYPKDE